MTRAPLRSLVFVSGAHALAALAALNYFRRAFNLSPWLLAVHLPLVVACLGMAVIAGGIVLVPHRLRAFRAATVAAASVPAVMVTALFILYVANFASNLWMGVNVTHKLADLWLWDWWRGGHILPISPSVVWLSSSSVIALFAIELGIWNQAFGAAVHRGWTITRPRPVTALAMVIIVAGYGVFFQQLTWRTPRSELLSADPILAFMRSTVAVEDARQREISSRLRHDEPLIRAGYPRDRAFTRKNVILFIVDSLRADHMQVYGYSRANTPFLASLMDNGKLRRVNFATSTCAESNCGILSTLFSKTLRHQVVEDFSLYNLLQDQGYDTRFILSGNHNWQGLEEMYGTGQTQYFDGQQSKSYGWSDDRVIAEGLEQVPDFKKPSFFFFHLMSVHLLGEKQEAFSVYQPAAVKSDWDALFRGEYDRESVTNNYDNGVLQADATIKDTFATLDRKGYLRNSIVVILADHGESLGEHGPTNFGHVTSLYQDLIHIPMLIYEDEPAEYGNLEFGTQMDVGPTILDRLGLPIPTSWEGVSLVKPMQPRYTVHQTTITTPCFAIVDHTTDRLYKFLQCAVGRREELYDLASDPDENHDLIATADPALLARFRATLEEWRSR